MVYVKGRNRVRGRIVDGERAVEVRGSFVEREKIVDSGRSSVKEKG